MGLFSSGAGRFQAIFRATGRTSGPPVHGDGPSDRDGDAPESGGSSQSFLIAFHQELADLAQVGCDHTRGNSSCKSAFAPFGSNPVCAVVLQTINSRFDQCMLFSGLLEFWCGFTRTILLIVTPFLWKNRMLHQGLDCLQVLLRKNP